MYVDYHVHLEEGPYSLRWWTRTAEALLSFRQTADQKHALEWMEDLSDQMNRRIKQGAYSRVWLDLYRKRAKELGLSHVGIVDHLYRFKEFKPYFEANINLGDDELGRMQKLWLDQVCCTSIDAFVSFIQEQKPIWESDGIDLRLGIEADYFSGGEAVLAPLIRQYPWDHVIGSVHFVGGWGFDNPDTQSRFAETDLRLLYRDVFQTVEEAISSGLFDIIAHLDNLKVFGHRPEEEQLLPYYQRIAQLLRQHDTATEINTGLFYRYPVKEMCPSPSFLRVLREQGVPITTSSDAHFPDHLGSFLPEARKALKAAGYTEIVTFEKRVRREAALQ
ncbi:histidinol phosphate phosphatase domain-containing protein [Brevibacillus borstelensis]|uniref:histidinol phosphate phosphatase domain-containing protein n=1 Tax=Brevibacillus borstelensis TaxID=45462 RepID=UPI00203E2ABF|nr:histidinol phosphate phosphatase domain-containing protein [Brevibacillus borstelensis]MCM3593006.1 histidinol phosphate phosphatase domain-containing protein [Brevibacillus borstelensis]